MPLVVQFVRFCPSPETCPEQENNVNRDAAREMPAFPSRIALWINWLVRKFGSPGSTNSTPDINRIAQPAGSERQRHGEAGQATFWRAI
jgi:hypothetical protein